ncbi:TPA: hypothetical protein ACWPB0_004678 [Salmonella enterica]
MENTITINKRYLILITGLILIYSDNANAAPTIAQILANGSNLWFEVARLASGLAFFSGIVISGMALFKMRDVSEGQAKVSSVLLLTFVGACLMTFPQAISTVTNSLVLGNTSGMDILSRVPVPDGIPGMKEGMDALFLFIKMIGHIAFFRGFLILKDIDKGQGGLSKALNHIVGGAMAINIDTVVEIMTETFLK